MNCCLKPLVCHILSRRCQCYCIMQLRTYLKSLAFRMYFEERWINLKEFFHYIDCVKVVRIRGYSGPYFPAFALITDPSNTECGNFSRRDLVEHLMSSSEHFISFAGNLTISYFLLFYYFFVIHCWLRYRCFKNLRNSFCNHFLLSIIVAYIF